ncbi:flagellar basal body-associated protein FliL [Shewanella maritima]|uniref:flagellar basal body-associated protein FliL n=1 Tax=Shewanella maritima TaxID=2520507 RepID=UPI0037367E6D
MAEELELDEKDSGSKKKKMIIFGVIGLVLLLAIGGAVWFFLGSSEPEADASADPQQSMESATAAPTGKANYVGMPRPFLFNLPGANRARLVEIKVQLMVRGSDDVLTRQHIPLIEDALLTTFSSADVEKLSTQAGKDELRQLALLNVQNTLQAVTGRQVVEQVLFTGFVMQ